TVLRSIRNRLKPIINPIFKHHIIYDKCRNKPWYHCYDSHPYNNEYNHVDFSFSKITPLNPPSTVPTTIAQPLLINCTAIVLINIAISAMRPKRFSFFTDGTSKLINKAYNAMPILSLNFGGMTSPSTPPTNDPMTQAR